MRLIDIILNKNVSDLSIVGLAKNVGKTVTLNYLIKEGQEKGLILGLTSTGRDGEKHDLLTQQKKPLILVPQNSLIATARECFIKADAKIEILETTNMFTPLGEIIIGRVRQEGFVELAGPTTSSQIRKVIKILKSFNSQLVVVDGAIDRVASAAPAVTQATLLATGAVLGHSIDTIIEKTALIKELFSLKRVEYKDVYNKAKEIISKKKIALYSMNNCGLKIKELDMKTALKAGKHICSEIDEDTNGVILNGALVDGIIEDILNTLNYNRLRKGLNIIVSDGTKVFLSPEVYRKFVAKGGSIKVVFTINLLAVTVNPFSPNGYSYEPFEFLNRMGTALAPIPVFDIMLNGKLHLEGGKD